ncbi:hypothetical protein [Microbulbifer halophilus]|uniref:Flp pilus-assembly TadG-like N-terminal domain-containing protein n=1 Tax=Microbulbifer halophilus TaxID=453963 RepID=A0ABW5EEG4_9GAMM|nr:hypothetical protein [Microbulbifer halophilus]MCW8126598.1 hypothetical protein [Microbulbifer halophilus]
MRVIDSSCATAGSDRQQAVAASQVLSFVFMFSLALLIIGDIAKKKVVYISDATTQARLETGANNKLQINNCTSMPAGGAS